MKLHIVRRGKKMATQMQATPILYGNDAKKVMEEVNKKPSKEQYQQLKSNYRKVFEGVRTKGFK